MIIMAPFVVAVMIWYGLRCLWAKLRKKEMPRL
jgi:hypothetical protein